MDPERRQFLEEAINSMTVNIVQQLEISLEVLTNPESTEDNQTAAIDYLLDYVDNIDTANDFCKIGGLEKILSILDPTQPHDTVKSRIASLIAELAQNNPYCQAKLHEMDVLSKLIPLVTNETVCCQAVRAISSLARNYEPLAAAFIEMGGLECLLGCLQMDNPRVKIQSQFLLTSMCTDYPELKGKGRLFMLSLKVINILFG